jgi:hypothetical protein
MVVCDVVRHDSKGEGDRTQAGDIITSLCVEKVIRPSDSTGIDSRQNL